MNDEQFASTVAGTEEQRDASARQVSNGFILNGIRRFLEPGTGALRLQQNVESIASDGASAGASVSTFLATGKF